MKGYKSKQHPKILLILGCGLLSGCMVGPNFQQPAPPDVQSYTQSQFPSKTVSTPLPGSGGKAQYFEHGKSIQAEWWKLFHSPALNHLISQGLKNSPNLNPSYGFYPNTIN